MNKDARLGDYLGHIVAACDRIETYAGHLSEIQFLSDTLIQDAVIRNPSPNPNNLWGSPKDLQGYTYDLEKAKADKEAHCEFDTACPGY